MTNKLSFEIEVIDSGKIKVKQFADDTKKAVEDISKSTGKLASASANLQEQYAKLISTVGAKKVFEELGSSAKKAEAEVASLGPLIEGIMKIFMRIATAYGIYKFFEDLYSIFKKATISTRQLAEEMKKIEDQLTKLKTPSEVLEFFRQEQAAARDLVEGLKAAETLLEASLSIMKQLSQQGRQSSEEYAILLSNVRSLAEFIEQGGRKLEVHHRSIVQAAEKYQELMALFEEFYQKLKERETFREQSLILQELIRAEDRATQAVYGELEAIGELDRLAKDRINTLNIQTQAEDRLTQAFNDGGQALMRLEDQYKSNLPAMIEFRKVTGEINQGSESLANSTSDLSENLRSYGVAVDGARQKQEDLNQTSRESINIFSGLLDVLGAFSGVLTALGINIGGAFQRVLSALSAFQNLGNTIARLAGQAGGQGGGMTGLFGAGGLLSRGWRWLTGGAGGAVGAAAGPAAALTPATLIMPPTVFGPALAPGLLTGIESAVAAGTEAGIGAAASGTALGGLATAALVGGVIGLPLLGFLLERRRSPEESFRNLMRYVERGGYGELGAASPLQALLRAAAIPGGAARTGLLPGPVERAALAIETAIFAGDVIAAGRAWTELSSVMAQFADNQWVQRLTRAMANLGVQIQPIINDILRVRGTLAPSTMPLIAHGIRPRFWAENVPTEVGRRGPFAGPFAGEPEYFEYIAAPRLMETITAAIITRQPQSLLPRAGAEAEYGLPPLDPLRDFFVDIDFMLRNAPAAATSLNRFVNAIRDIGVGSEEAISAAQMLGPALVEFFRQNYMDFDATARLIWRSFLEGLYSIEEYGLGGVEALNAELERFAGMIDTVTESIRRQLAALVASGQEGIDAMVGLLNNLTDLNQQITERIQELWPPTLEARISALTEIFAEFERQLADPALTLEERANRLRGFFETVTRGADDLIGQLQRMAAENQAAAREIERLSRDIYNLRREEEERRRGIARAIFEAGLVGRFPDEAQRLRRQFLITEALRIKTLLESGGVTGAERIRVAEQGQGIAEEIFRLYGQDELVSLEELANVQRDVITALQFIDDQIQTGYREQIEPLQDQLQTQRDLLTTNQAMLQANFGVQTAAEAIESIQNTAAGYLETIRDRVISFGAEIANQLAPLLGADSPIYRELMLQNIYVQTGNNLIDSGFQNLRRPIEAIQAELPNIPQNIANYLAAPMAELRKSIEGFGPILSNALKFTLGGGAPAALTAASLVEAPIPEPYVPYIPYQYQPTVRETATAILQGTRVEYPGILPQDVYNLMPSPFRDMLLQNWAAVVMGRQILPYDENTLWRAYQNYINQGGGPVDYAGILPRLQAGGFVKRTGIAVVEEGETVIPAGRTGGSPLELNLELHLHQTIDGATEETIIRKVIPVIYEQSRNGRDVVHVNGVVNV